MQIIDSIWKALEPKVGALITRRLICFHDQLVEDGQIRPSLTPSDPEETPCVETPNHCSEEQQWRA